MYFLDASNAIARRCRNCQSFARCETSHFLPHITLELTALKFTSIVTDTLLQTMASSLCQLKKLHLAGCPKITHRGIIELLGPNTAGIKDLALEGVSPSFVRPFLFRLLILWN